MRVSYIDFWYLHGVIKALIIDDEPGAATVLQLLIERYVPAITQVRVAVKISEAHSLVRQFEPDLVFLDIMMPEKNGFEWLGEVGKITFEVIFTTAFNEFAIRAIRFSALDYLLKPINADELKTAVERFTTKQQQQQQSDLLLKNLLSNLEQQKETDFKLAVPTVTGALFFSPADIIRLEGEGNYTRFFMVGNQKHLIAKTMKEYQDILIQHQFIRIHKSHLVNRAFIQSYLNEGAVVLKDKMQLPVSRQRKQEIAALLKGWL